jgi:predicted  nucleic acid-binding Zn-ribbon protein
MTKNEKALREVVTNRRLRKVIRNMIIADNRMEHFYSKKAAVETKIWHLNKKMEKLKDSAAKLQKKEYTSTEDFNSLSREAAVMVNSPVDLLGKVVKKMIALRAPLLM